MTSDKKAREWKIRGSEYGGLKHTLCDGPVPEINEFVIAREVLPDDELAALRGVNEKLSDELAIIKYRLTESERKLFIAVSALSFYANERNWKSSSAYTKQCEKISLDDCSAAENWHRQSGGKRARAALEEIEKL